MKEVKNAYPELPVLKYKKTIISLEKGIDIIRGITMSETLPAAAVKAGMYVFYYIESDQGRRGINNNYIGAQADGGRWPADFDQDIAGTVVLKENGTGKYRRFVAFKDPEACFLILADRIARRGFYIGGKTYRIVKMDVTSPETFAVAYKRDWVTGSAEYIPTQKEINWIAGLYREGLKLFGG